MANARLGLVILKIGYQAIGRESAAADPSRLKNRYPGDSVLLLSCVCALHALEPLRSAVPD